MQNNQYDINVAWMINRICNLDCPYCYYDSESRKNPYYKGKKDINKIVDTFNKTEKICLINIAGGEPFLFPGFTELCEKLTKKHFIKIDTNLTISKEIKKFAEKISPEKTTFINSSLHYSELKRLNLKKQFIENYHILKNKNFDIDIHLVMWPPNLDKIEEIYNEFEKEGISLKPVGFKGKYNNKKYPDSYNKDEIEKMEHYFKKNAEIRKIEKNKSPSKNIKQKEEPEKILKMIKRKKDIKNIFRGRYSFKGIPCLAGKSSIRIDYEGNIKRCVTEKMILGNIFTGKLKLLNKPLKCTSELCICDYEGIYLALGNPKILNENKKSLFERLFKKIKKENSSKNKYKKELEYWKKKKNLGNSFYQYYYTACFNIDKSFYDNKKILDIGCGPRGSLEWADNTKERIGLDPLSNQYKKLHTHKQKMKYLNAFSENIPYPNEYFDIVTSFNSLDHVDNLELSIKEIKRVLKKGGTFLLITEINHKSRDCEPQKFSEKIIEKFFPELKITHKKIYQKSNGIYQSINQNIEYKKNNSEGILIANFIKEK